MKHDVRERQLVEMRLGGLNFAQIFSHLLFKKMRLITFLFCLQMLISKFYDIILEISLEMGELYCVLCLV